MPSLGHDIVVLGTSAGGLDALDMVVGDLPSGLPATIFLVQHLSAEASGEAVLHRLRKHKHFKCKLGRDGEAFERGVIYLAPSDNHMLVKASTLLVTKGARENRSRPAVDPLFRSAAVNHRSRVIGVVLTGMLDDGTAGLRAIKQCGGITCVQNPADAEYPEMPQSAVNNVDVDHCVDLAEMGALITRLVHTPHGPMKPIPQDVKTEAIIAERVLSDIAQVSTLGSQVPYNCPNCGGVLWQMEDATECRYRCHTGHSYTAPALLASQSEKIEETLWICLRMLEERANLMRNMSLKHVRPNGTGYYQERLKDNQVHIERIRKMLQAKNEG
ncbi:MAG: CheB methylesterase [Cyanobacteria bacterium RYN_339]|nr:CheB methylesterase [Cyanobacteria bacterium RYN_339]